MSENRSTPIAGAILQPSRKANIPREPRLLRSPPLERTEVSPPGSRQIESMHDTAELTVDFDTFQEQWLCESFGRYEMEGEFARGAMGAIFKGRDTELGREIAFKF